MDLWIEIYIFISDMVYSSLGLVSYMR